MDRAVVIIGAGFAGLDSARAIEKLMPRDKPIVLFSQENHIVFTPLLGNVVGSSINPNHVVWPVRQMLKRTHCRTATVTGIDLVKREVSYRTLTGLPAVQPFEHLVLACGMVTNLDIVPGMAAHGWPIKTMGDALVLRNHLIEILEAAQTEPSAEARRELLSVVVVGGGFSGVEVAGEIADLLHGSARYYTEIDPSDIRVTLIHRGERLLPELAESLGDFAAKKMRQRGIDVCLKSETTAVTEHNVILKSGREIPARTVICTIGNSVSPLLVNSGLPLERGRLKVSGDFRVEGHENIWALGDCAAVPNAYDGKTSPPTGQFAQRQARWLARNIDHLLRGQDTEPFHYKPMGAFASIGSRSAVGQALGLKISGFPAWFLWRGIYLAKMPTFARKLQIAFDWFWQMLFPRDIVQLKLDRTERLTRVHCEAGQFVFRKGDPGDRLYIIERGKVGVYLDENQPPVVILAEGEHFGEGALMAGTPRSASLKAEEPTDLIALGQEAFGQITRHCTMVRKAFEQTREQRHKNSSISSKSDASAVAAQNAAR